MRFLLATGSLWTYSVARCFALAAAAGYDGIELLVDRRWETRQADSLRRLSEQHHLPISVVHAPFLPAIAGWPEENVGRLKQATALAEALGAAIVVHHPPARLGFLWVQVGPRFFPVPVPGWRPDAPYRRWLREEYAAFQATTAVRLCLENMPTRPIRGRRWRFHHWGHHDDMTPFSQLTLDTTHLGTWGADPTAVYEQLAGRVAHIHLSNYDGREHLRPETGHLDLARFLARLAATGYDGRVTLELNPEALDAGAPDEVVTSRLAGSLAFCRRAVAGAAEPA